jgi:hypothetical protein
MDALLLNYDHLAQPSAGTVEGVLWYFPFENDQVSRLRIN